MRRTLFTILLVFAAALFSNGAAAQNIVHGVKVVVIDAGHGGKFPGAHYAGVKEKDLTLRAALELGRLIEENMPGVKVVYTRKTDMELGETLAADLQKRADIANRAGGDLFVSIHVNAARSTAARGVETLIMGESPKEQRYNEDALFANNREDLIDMSDEKTAAIVRAYIQNLQFTYGQYSMAMARCIQRQYQKAGRQDRGIKPQLLRVLYATDMPGVLTEIGFMSNTQEAAYMKSEKGLNEIARSLFEAVKSYADFVKGTQEADEAEAASVSSGAGSSPREEIPAATLAGPEAVTPAAEPAGSPAAQGPKDQNPAAESAKAEKPAAKSDASAAKSGYTVQVLASPEKVSLDSPRFKNYKDKVKQYSADGKYCYKYCIGFFAERNAAQQTLTEVRRTFPDAFVVRCEGGKVVK